MKRITISALTLDECEIMLKIIDRWLRAYYNVDGVQRRNSWNRRANDGIRAQIVGLVHAEAWNLIHENAVWEIMRTLHKPITDCTNYGDVADVSTEEASI